jgi:Tfp pilus assembly protein PilF
VSRTGNALPEFLNNTAMASCNDALASKLMVKDRVATLVNRGTLEAAALNIDAALADYDAALALRPQMADVHLDRGAALMRADRYDQARAEFDKALAMGTKSAHIAYLDRGMAEEKSGDVSAAYRDYKQALVVNPNFQEARAELSRFQVEERVAADR